MWQIRNYDLVLYQCCVLRVIVLLEDEPSAQSEVLSTLDQAFLKIVCWSTTAKLSKGKQISKGGTTFLATYNA